MVQFLTKLAKSSGDLKCLSETTPRLLVRPWPKKDASLDVGLSVLEIIGLAGMEVGVIPLYVFSS